ENLVSNNYVDGQNYGQLYHVNDAIYYYQGSTIRLSSAGGSVPQNAYTHVALTYDGSVNRLYLNGDLVVGSADVTAEVTKNQLILAYAIRRADSRLAGRLD